MLDPGQIDNKAYRLRSMSLAVIIIALVICPGCRDGNEKLIIPRWPSLQRPTTQPSVPQPISLLLPHGLRIHPFTGTRTFDEHGGIKGIEVRIETLDAFGDPVKAFGDFRFELYTYRPGNPERRGEQINLWEASLLDPKLNAIHWDKVHRTYVFRLKWTEPIPVGRKLVLAAVFSSPFTDRLFAQRVFTCGE